MRLLRQLFRVATGPGSALAEIDLQELRAEALHLLLHHRPRVERFDDGTEPPRRRDRL